MFISEDIRKLYEARHARYITAMQCGTPDRIPIRFLLQEAAARICGVDNQTVAIDYNQAFECTRKAGEILGCDSVMLNAIWSNYGVSKAAGWKYMHVPGVDTELWSVQQFSEPSDPGDAFLRADEYAEFTSDPTAFILNKWFARNTMRCVESGEKATLEHNASLMRGAMAYANYMNAFGPAAYKLKYESGLVGANSGMIKAPLDLLMDKFRGYEGCVVDCLERPEEVRKACEALIPHIIANALNSADPAKEVPITIWAHRGCVPFISPKIFDEIFWPTLLPVFQEIISKGYQILFYGEGNWEAHYDTLRTLPAESIIYHLDKGSPELAAKKLKDKFAISGGLSYDVLARGEKEDVEKYMERLFACMKPDGGYILDATALLLSDIKPENLQTAVRYTMEHGAYSRTIPPKKREACGGVDVQSGKRPPNVVRSWEEERTSYKKLDGNVDAVRQAWQNVDAALYNYIWTTVLW